MEAALRALLPADPTAGDTSCVQAGADIADTIVANNRRSRRRTFMLPSPRLACAHPAMTQKPSMPMRAHVSCNSHTRLLLKQPFEYCTAVETQASEPEADAGL